MNIQTNPWSLGPADVASALIVASPGGLTLNSDGTVTLTCGALTFNTGSAGAPRVWLTIADATNAAYNGFYLLLSGASGGTVFVLAPQFVIPAGTLASGGGEVAQCLYPWQIRLEDISWQNASALGQLLDLRDRNGNIVWQATATGVGSQNRGKLFWIEGLSPITIQSGVIILTID